MEDHLRIAILAQRELRLMEPYQILSALVAAAVASTCMSPPQGCR